MHDGSQLKLHYQVQRGRLQFGRLVECGHTRQITTPICKVSRSVGRFVNTKIELLLMNDTQRRKRKKICDKRNWTVSEQSHSNMETVEQTERLPFVSNVM